jgi:hypothetical protein
MLRVGFEPTIPVFERANTVHASDCAATVLGNTHVGDIHYFKTATGKWLLARRLGFSSRQGQDFYTAPTPALGPNPSSYLIGTDGYLPPRG